MTQKAFDSCEYYIVLGATTGGCSLRSAIQKWRAMDEHCMGPFPEKLTIHGCVCRAMVPNVLGTLPLPAWKRVARKTFTKAQLEAILNDNANWQW